MSNQETEELFCLKVPCSLSDQEFQDLERILQPLAVYRREKNLLFVPFLSTLPLGKELLKKFLAANKDIGNLQVISSNLLIGPSMTEFVLLSSPSNLFQLQRQQRTRI
jgi:hypothetical protein